MSIAKRRLLSASCVALLLAIACGGGFDSPTGPSSDPTGATITGTVNGSHAMSAPPAGFAAAPPGLTVSVVGTNLSSAVDASGQFNIAGVPSGNVQLLFKDPATTNATVQLPNVGQDELIEIQVNVNGTNATIVNEVRSTGKVVLCHNTGTSTYQKIEVSVSAEPAHRAHGDGEVGDPVPADTTKVFDSNCVPVAATGASVKLVKSTNGQDANSAPGPKIDIGSPVTWQYVVTNTGSVPLTNVAVVDDRGVVVSCGGQTTLAVGQSMTCTGTGVATAGQYTNVGTVTAASTLGPVTDSDPSNYFGQVPGEDDDGLKVQICHVTGNGKYVLIEISVNAEPAHRAHGDGKIGESVPGQPGKTFGPGCSVS